VFRVTEPVYAPLSILEPTNTLEIKLYGFPQRPATVLLIEVERSILRMQWLPESMT
jgi:hypothetical protein